MSESADQGSGRYRMLTLLAVAELLAMTLWFSASAVGPELATAIIAATVQSFLPAGGRG
ncbi:hypothetical protein [Halovenus amylolytica]|uniref:hypothetical protein n=1 Tax=Halovenus amylolytica TaxID=2500550 RepID=UPI003D6BC884